MKRINGYYEQIEINGRTYTVSIIKKGTGKDAMYWGYVMNECGYSKELCGHPIYQKYTNPPHWDTPEDIMDMAIYEAENSYKDVDRIEHFEDILFDFMDDVDRMRADNRTDSESEE